jgi:hypothetical protein
VLAQVGEVRKRRRDERKPQRDSRTNAHQRSDCPGTQLPIGAWHPIGSAICARRRRLLRPCGAAVACSRQVGASQRQRPPRASPTFLSFAYPWQGRDEALRGSVLLS